MPFRATALGRRWDVAGARMFCGDPSRRAGMGRPSAADWPLFVEPWTASVAALASPQGAGNKGGSLASSPTGPKRKIFSLHQVRSPRRFDRKRGPLAVVANGAWDAAFSSLSFSPRSSDGRWLRRVSWCARRSRMRCRNRLTATAPRSGAMACCIGLAHTANHGSMWARTSSVLGATSPKTAWNRRNHWVSGSRRFGRSKTTTCGRGIMRSHRA